MVPTCEDEAAEVIRTPIVPRKSHFFFPSPMSVWTHSPIAIKAGHVSSVNHNSTYTNPHFNMKTAITFCALSFAISAVNATHSESNAQRLARGLPPLPPRRRYSGAKRSTTSSTPFHCDTKKTFCCSISSPRTAPPPRTSSVVLALATAAVASKSPRVASPHLTILAPRARWPDVAAILLGLISSGSTARM
ncbi:hypothetical protein B0H13DRAFT_735693 [Mycena leptocephala]|nr:hypothetical protein B0H13DRAFT_735693 [Mycena leptocephala]